LENSVQPCSLLLLVGPDWRIAAISANAGMLGDHRPADLVDRPLADLIGGKSIHALRNRMAWLSNDESEVHDFGIEWGEIALDLRATRDGDNHLIEAELTVEPRLPDSIGMVRSMSDRLSGSEPIELARLAMRQLCALTGFEHFRLTDRNGQILAAAGRPDTQCLPAVPDNSAGPQVIADLDAEPVAIVGNIKGTDLRHASFLAPGEETRKLMATTGVASAMTFPLRIDGHHVGYLRGEHSSPRRCSAERRSVAHLFAERLVARMARQGWQP